jgi:hypothetical protein
MLIAQGSLSAQIASIGAVFIGPGDVTQTGEQR